MKLRNKKTGEIVEDFSYILLESTKYKTYDSLAELNEEWEDYKEPKDIWWLDNEGIVNHASGDVNDSFRKNRKIGNYFLSQEEAEKAIEKLKAWKRLKDKGFKFTGWEDLETLDQEESLLITRDVVDGSGVVGFRMENYDDCINDLDLLFGGEE